MLKSVAKALRDMFAGKAVVDKPAKKKKKKAKAGSRDAEIGALRKTAKRVMTPERKKLIEDALRVQRAKARILDDLEDEDKRKLYAAAVKAFLHEDDGRGGS